MVGPHRVKIVEPRNRLKTLDAICFPDSLEDAWEESTWWAVYLHHKIIAYAGIRLDSLDDIWFWELSRCGVHPQHRGKGLHKWLVELRVEHTLRMNFGEYVATYTGCDNLPSQRSLVFCGFKRVGGSESPWVNFRLSTPKHTL